MKNRGAMELSSSTIVVVVLSILVLVFGVVFVNKVMCSAINGVDSINQEIEDEILGLFSEGEVIVIKEFNNVIPKGVVYGVGFAVRDNELSGDLSYTVEIEDLGDCSFDKKVAEDFILLGKSAEFNLLQGEEFIGLIKFLIPLEIHNCNLRYKISVFDQEQVKSSRLFDMEIINKKFTNSFCS